jgi:carbonic anhydrase/acetyltransferase-like protein (isoleucine patch superfamily)
MAIESLGELSPVIHPTAWVHSSAVVLADVHLAEDVSVWPTVVLRGDSGRITIGARTNLQDGTIAHATTGVSTTTIGEECVIGHRVTLHGCTVGARCLVGMGSTLMDNVVLGDGCFVAAGSLIPPGKVFEPRSFILGSPARRIREVTEQETAAIDHGWRAYLALMRRYRAQAQRP